MNYYERVLQDDLTVSVDMIRIDFKMRYGRYFPLDVTYPQYFADWLSQHMDFYFEHYLSSASFRYRHLFVFKTDTQTTFSVGLEFNGIGNSEESRKGFLEFNPNKILHGWSRVSCDFDDIKLDGDVMLQPHEIFNAVYNCLCNLCTDMTVKRYDMAIDIPVPRSLVSLHKDRRNYMCYKVSDEDFSEYLGKRASENYVKVYNKQIESKLPDPLTRVELTLSLFTYDDFLNQFPVVFISQDQISDTDGLNATDRVLCDLLMDKDFRDREGYLRRLGRNKYNKLKPYLLSGLEGKGQLHITEETYHKVVDIVNRFHRPMMADLSKGG